MPRRYVNNKENFYHDVTPEQMEVAEKNAENVRTYFDNQGSLLEAMYAVYQLEVRQNASLTWGGGYKIA